MFSGIIQEIGRIVRIEKSQSGTRLCLDAGKVSDGLKISDSIAVDGVCLTVTKKQRRRIWIDLSAETLQRSNFGEKAEGDLVNLELPITPASFLSGHLVQGHVEGIGRVKSWVRNEADVRLVIDLPSDLLQYCIPKGSICINGVSLTIASLKKKTISVALIPFTLAHTNLDSLQPGDGVNVETDLVGRYVVTFLQKSYHRTK